MALELTGEQALTHRQKAVFMSNCAIYLAGVAYDESNRGMNAIQFVVQNGT
jgi:hypothetical protein